MKRSLTTFATALLAALATGTVLSTILFAGLGTNPALAAGETASVERGRYLVKISGCNDCHTAGFPESGGRVPESEWLTGTPVGFQGPWGTTYPANLRLAIDRMTEQQWLARAHGEMRPPMPWFNLREMSDDDLRSIYRYVKSLGPKGVDAPAYAAPGQPVATPYIVFVPQNVKQASAGR